MQSLHILLFVLLADSISLISVRGDDNGIDIPNAPPSLLIVIRNQVNDYHQRSANAKKAELQVQIIEGGFDAKVILIHEEWPVEMSWTVLPIIPDMARKYSDDYQWIMFIEEQTEVNLNGLMRGLLPKHDHDEDILLGRCLHDNSPSIIHHFAFFDGKPKSFKYPDFDAGWLMSRSLVQRLALEWDPENTNMDFQIDVKHEIAMYLNDKLNVKVTCVKELCGGNAKNEKSCVTKIDPSLPSCGDRISLNDILVSVKTTLKFHKDRLAVVQKTWGKYVPNIIYYSNVTDDKLGTIDCGVPNTDTGHCGKMQKIIEDAHDERDLQNFKWLMIADDDTILSVSRLVKLLNCYDPKHVVVLGERYGYGLVKEGYGYGYITGGGGMVLSRGAIEAWKKKECDCPSIRTPDDMYLGQCFSFSVGVPVTHSPLFHQARPDDYSDGYLGNQQPVSFHKHWEVDPIKVYADWFESEDSAAYDTDQQPAPTQAPEPQVVPIPPTPVENQPKDEL